MIAAIIRWSASNRLLVLIGAAFLVAWGIYAVRHIPLDAIPDLSDTQVIVYTEYSGPGAAGGRGPGHLSADHGDAQRAALEGGARLLLLRRLVRLRHLRGRHRHLLGAQPRARISELRAAQPAGRRHAVARPDATGVGWVYQYVVQGAQNIAGRAALAPRTGTSRYQLAKAPGVAEVASVGGFVKQYQVVVDPQRLQAYGISLTEVRDAIRASNMDVGGRMVEMTETEYMVRGRGYLHEHRGPRADRAQGRGRHAGAAAGRRPRRARPGRAARHHRAQRRGRGGRRHRAAALRRERARRHRERQGQARGDRPGLPGGRLDRAGLRPLGADLPRHRHPEAHADRGEHHRRARLLRLPAACRAAPWSPSSRCRSAC